MTHPKTIQFGILKFARRKSKVVIDSQSHNLNGLRSFGIINNKPKN